MEYISWFIFSFIFVYIIYYILFIRRSKKNEKVPSEAQYLISVYKLDVNKFSYHKFLKVVGFVTSFDIAIVATIVVKVDGMIWQILFGFVAVVPIVVLSFMLLGKYYQNKEKKDNSKELEKEKKYLSNLEKKEKKKKQKNRNKKKGK